MPEEQEQFFRRHYPIEPEEKVPEYPGRLPILVGMRRCLCFLYGLYAGVAKRLVADASGFLKVSLAADARTPPAPTVDSYGSAVVDCGADATTEVIATPGTGHQLWIYALFGTSDTADATVVLESAGDALSGAPPLADNGGYCLPPSGEFRMPWLKCATNEAFNITTVGGTFDGTVSYAVVDA